ncbi:unnamed protein product [Prunus armeniaca]
MPGVEIDRSTLWKKARQDKYGNIPDPKVAEKAKLIHPGRVRGVGAGISPRQYFNLPKQQRIKFADHLKESVRIVLQAKTKKMEARSREETLRMEARTKQLVEAERENLLSQLSQLIPNFDPSMLKPKTSPCQNQSPKNPMSDKASCSGADVRSLHFEDDTAKNGEQQEETHKTSVVYLLRRLKPLTTSFFFYRRDKLVITSVSISVRRVKLYNTSCLYDCLREANMCSMVGFINPAQVSANAGSLTDRSRIVVSRLQKTDGEHIFMMPYNPGRHWVLLIVRAKRETVYFLDPLPGNRVVDEEGKNIVNSALKIYNSHIGRPGRKTPIWKTLPGTPKQPSSVEWAEFVCLYME